MHFTISGVIHRPHYPYSPGWNQQFTVYRGTSDHFEVPGQDPCYWWDMHPGVELAGDGSISIRTSEDAIVVEVIAGNAVFRKTIVGQPTTDCVSVGDLPLVENGYPDDEGCYFDFGGATCTIP